MSDSFKISVDENKRYAYIEFFTKTSVSQEEVVEELKRLNITHGVKTQLIFDLILNPILNEKIKIAEYTPPKEPENDKFKFYIDTEVKPRETKIKTDFYNLDFIKDVKKGQKLFNYYKGKEGEDGKLVDGSVLPSKNERTAFYISHFINTDLVDIVDEGDNIISGYAKTNSAYIVKDEKVYLSNKLFIEGDQNFKTGNLISKYASIRVSGNVADKFIIKSRKNVWVGKDVKNAEIYAANLVVEGDITKGDRKITVLRRFSGNSIINRKNFYSSKIICKGDIRGSEIGVSEICECNKLAGGITFIGQKLTCNILGGESSVSTIIVIGEDKQKHDKSLDYETRIRKMKKIIRMMKEELVKVGNEELALEKNHREEKINPDTYIFKKKQLESDRGLLKEDIDKETNKLKDIEIKKKLFDDNPLYKNVEIIVNQKLNPGTVIKYGKDKVIRVFKEYGSCKISIDNKNDIVITEI